MKLLTPCQDNTIKVGVRIVRRHPAGLLGSIKSLTSYQANRTKVGVRIVSQKAPS